MDVEILAHDIGGAIVVRIRLPLGTSAGKLRLMATRRDDHPDLEALRAQKQRLDAARAAIKTLTPAERGMIFLEMESEIGVKTAPPQTKPTSKSTKPATSKTGKATSKFATRSPSYATLAENFIMRHPHGVRTHEVGKAIGQRVSNAFGTLKLLERQNRVIRYGTRNNTLWTPPNVPPPAPRVETIASAIVKVLSDASGKPVDVHVLHATVANIVSKATKKKPRTDSITTEIYRMSGRGVIRAEGANENGPMYVLGEGGDSATLN